MAGALLVTLSVSAAFGAPPASEGNRGRSIAAFVHELVFGNDETQGDADEELVEDEDELSEGDELVIEDALDDELDELDELDEDETDELANAHGQCVAEEASDKSDEVDEDRNHGAVVSEAARETCWETEEEVDELVDGDGEEPADEEEDEDADSHGACVSAAAQDREGSAESELKNHGKWVNQHARYTCWDLEVPTDEETSDVEDASLETDDDADKGDKADRGNGKPSWAGSGNGNGNGYGRGGNRR